MSKLSSSASALRKKASDFIGSSYDAMSFHASGIKKRYTQAEDLDMTTPDGATWKRLSEFVAKPQLFCGGTSSNDICQGDLGDCYLLGALSVLAQRDDLMKKLIKKQTASGFVCQFFKNGQWVEVEIDDKFLVTASNKPLYAHGADPNETWLMVLEKAYATLHGSYKVIEEGTTHEALVDLTGGIADMELLGDQAGDLDELWARIFAHWKDGFLMGVMAQGGSESEEPMECGILWGHAYAVLKMVVTSTGVRLIKCRNPWGMKEWNGPWSDKSDKWTPALKAELGLTDADDGEFYMELQDFCNVFTHLGVCRLYNDEVGDVWSQFEAEGVWDSVTAGGCTNNETWINNPQFLLSVGSSPPECFISISQADRRMQHLDNTYPISISFMVVKTDDPSRKKLVLAPEEIVHVANFSATRQHGDDIVLEANTNYIIIPMTYDPNEFTHFHLLVSLQHKKGITFGRLPDPVISSVEGSWNAATAGGASHHPTFWKNPQYSLVAAASETVTLELRSTNPEVPVAIYQGNPGLRGLLLNDSTISRPTFNTIWTEKVAVQKGTSYNLIPASFEANTLVGFRLSVAGSVAHKIQPLDSSPTLLLQGEWNGSTAGGCSNTPAWKKNPLFTLSVAKTGPVIIALSADKAYAPAIIISTENFQGTHFLGPTPFTTGKAAITTVTLEAGHNYKLMALTFAAGQEGPFSLAFFSENKVSCSSAPSLE